MSNDNDLNQDAETSVDDLPELSPAAALEALKTRADRMGVKYHPSISYDKLAEKVAAALQDSPAKEDKPASRKAVAEPEEESENSRRARLKRQAFELVRIRMTCMNPAKREWEGELFTAGNSVVGSVTKYVPFNNDEGWHVPRIILNQIQQRMCQIFVTVKDSRGNSARKGKLIKEFAVEVLPQLTKEELDELARRQAMSKAID